MKKILVLTSVIILVVALTGLFLVQAKASGKTNFKMAGIFPGSIMDGDYNSLGYIGLQETGKAVGLDVSYSEKVAVSDFERVLKEHVNDGCNIIWVHGGEYKGSVDKLAPNYPEVTFIIELDYKPDKLEPNIWYTNRNWYPCYYVFGYLAALKTKTDKIGFIGAFDIPFIRAQMNAAKQGLRDAGSDAKFEYIYAGSFDDPLKARQAAEGLIARDNDIILSTLNLGSFGLASAAKEAAMPVYYTTELGNYINHTPDNFLSSCQPDFSQPLIQIVPRIMQGEKSGYILMEFGEGKAISVLFPINNVSEEINKKIKEIIKKVADGKIKVVVESEKMLP